MFASTDARSSIRKINKNRTKTAREYTIEGRKRRENNIKTPQGASGQ